MKTRMLIHVAIKKMNPGDEWKSDHYLAIMASDRTLITCQGASLNMNDGILNEFGEIIPTEPKPKTNAEMRELLTDTFKGSIFDKPEIIDSMVRILDICNKKPEEKPAPESEKVLGVAEHWKRSHFNPHLTNKQYFFGGYRDGKEDGRLERDIELRGLIGCIGDNIESLAHDGYECIVEYFKNTNPLKDIQEATESIRNE